MKLFNFFLKLYSILSKIVCANIHEQQVKICLAKPKIRVLLHRIYSNLEIRKFIDEVIYIISGFL